MFGHIRDEILKNGEKKYTRLKRSSTRTETHISTTFAANPSSACPFFSRKRLQSITADAMFTVSIMLSSLTHLILSISCSYLIKFHDFADNNQEGMKHQMRGATQAQLGMTLCISLLHKNIFILFSVLNANL